jgi:hypothetical protein
MNLKQTNKAFADSLNSGHTASRIESVLIAKAQRGFQLFKKGGDDE